jgi:hypothetical protein
MGHSGFEVATPPPLADAHLRSLYQYWRELARAASVLPSIQAFDPLHLPKVLPHIWIVEVDSATQRFRVRLAGESINAIYGRNIGGQYFGDVYDPSDVDTIVARYGRCLSQPAIFRATGSVYAAAGRLTEGERLALPMLGRGGVTDTLLGATVYGGKVERHADVLVTGDAPEFFPVHAANHKPPVITGP